MNINRKLKWKRNTNRFLKFGAFHYREPWMPEQDLALESCYLRFSCSKIAAMLGRTLYGVEMRVRRIK